LSFFRHCLYEIGAGKMDDYDSSTIGTSLVLRLVNAH